MRRPSAVRGRPWSPGRERESTRRARTAVVLAVLTALTVMTLDAGTGDDSPLDPARSAAGRVFGPMESGLATLTTPVVSAIDTIADVRRLHGDNARLEREVDELRAELSTVGVDRDRLAQYDALAGVSEGTGFRLVPARVVAMGPAQAFARTVTIDAGSADGVHADMTVLESGGLVGRVLRADPHTATVLLAVDADSTVGGRVGRSMKVGFLHGRGDLGQGARLDLELVDQTYVPAEGETVVTWGSQEGAPYVSGVPVGRVDSVYSSLRETTQRAVIEPFVDFSALDVVGVVVPSGTTSDRGIIEGDGSLR